jgi:hypothetical protein
MFAMLGGLAGVAACGDASRAEDSTAEGTEEGEQDLIDNPPGSAAVGPQLAPGYEALSAKAKQQALWKIIAADEYCGRAGDAANGDRKNDYATDACLAKLPTGGGGYALTALKSIFKLAVSFDRSSDEMPKGRHKIFHPFGVAGTVDVTFDYPESPEAGTSSRKGLYTGMFAPNAAAPVAAIARLAPGGGGSFTPGIAVKYLVDGQPSVNTHCIEGLDGQGKDFNFFAHTLTNHLPDPRAITFKIASNIFKLVKPDPLHLPVNHLASVAPDGTSVSESSRLAPYQIFIKAHGDLATKFPNAERADFRIDLRTIAPGTVIYDILATALPGDAAPEKIGEIKTTSWLVASASGDYQLFFRHAR